MALNGGVFRVDPAPQSPTRSVATLPASVGSRPPFIGAARAALMALTVCAWPIDKGPAFTQAQSNPKQIAPLTLVYGDQPPLTSFVTTQETALLRSSWDALSLPTQQAPRLIVGTAALAVYFGQPQSQSVPLAAWSGSPRLVTQSNGVATIPAPVVVASVPAPQPQTVALGSWQAVVAPVRQSGIAALLPAPAVASVPFQRAPLLTASWAPTWQAPPQPSTAATLAIPAVVASSLPVPAQWGLVLAAWSPRVVVSPQSPRLIQSADAPAPDVVTPPLSLPYALRSRR